MEPSDISTPEMNLHRSARAKRIRLVVKNDLSLHVYAPLHCEDSVILAMVERHRLWIFTQMHRLTLQARQMEQSLENHPDEILVFGEWVDYEARINKSYVKSALQEYLEKQVAHYAREMHTDFKQIRTRYNKRVLGSCSFDNKLSFSLLLFFASREEIDYIIIHELAHTKHKNHSPRFWNLVREFCADYKKLREKLHQNMPLYSMLYRKYFA